MERATEKRLVWPGAVGMWAMIAGAITALGGCGASMQRAAGPSEAQRWEGAGGSWALVMQTPRTAQLLAGADPRAGAEYGRNDAALGAGRDGPLLATSEWPERERPDLFYARRIQLETRASELLWFDSDSRSRGTYRRGDYAGGSGTWGFWR